MFRRLYRRFFPRPRPALDARLIPGPPSGPDEFTCNVCGACLRLERAKVTREAAHCPACGSYSRLRSVVYALTRHLGWPDPVLARARPRPELRGLGCSDAAAYAPALARLCSYTNTFYDREPRLDLLAPDWKRFPEGGHDFITCTDVLEHVPPPVETAFANLRRLLKPGGALILSVPTTDEAATREHFPGLRDWSLAHEEGGHVLLGKRPDGSLVRHEKLCFHGGEGLTLEFRVFSRLGLLASLEGSGFRVAQVLDQPVAEYGISLCEHNLVVAAQRPAG